MRIDKENINEVLISYLQEGLSEEGIRAVNEWRFASDENEKFYQQTCYAWKAKETLDQMEQFNSFEALKSINKRLKESKSFLYYFYRIAAVLLLPLLSLTAYFTIQQISTIQIDSNKQVLQTVKSMPGMISVFTLADGTRVWLNGGSELTFPVNFEGKFREVKLKGEGYFDVVRNKNMPFRVNANVLKVDVLGTSFNVTNYEDDDILEVVLVEGKVEVTKELGHTKKYLGTMKPGERVIYDHCTNKAYSQKVDVEKYIAWKDGQLVFKDDKMEDVIRRLSRWFNVEIIVEDEEIMKYVYTAAISSERMEQVLKLLTLSAPLQYEIVESKLLPDGNQTKQKIKLRKK